MIDVAVIDVAVVDVVSNACGIPSSALYVVRVVV